MTPEEQGIYDRNARLARAVGYERVEKYHKGMRIIQIVGLETGVILMWEFGDTPDGHFAKSRLLRWLAEDDERWHQFIRALRPGILTNDYGKWMMLATPDQVAEAAERSLREGGFYKEKRIE